MKKKLLALVLVVALAVTSIVGGTLAYQTDTDAAVNVMTLGNVDVVQHELQRAEGVAHNATAVEGSLVPFEQGKPLYPAYPETTNAYTAEATELFYWGPYVTAEGAGNGLWDDENLNGAMDKFVMVENTGTSDCYYRTWIAFECPEGMEYSQGPDKEFMMNINGHKLFTREIFDYVEIEGTRYLVMVATYNEVLKAGEISRPSLLQVVMTHNVTNEQVALLKGSYEILVFTQACQTENFPDAETALDVSFGERKIENHPWQNGIAGMPWDGETIDTGWYNENDTTFTLNDAEQLAGFAKLVNGGTTFAGKIVELGADIDLAGMEWTPIGLNADDEAKKFFGTFDGKGHTISGLYVATEPSYTAAGLFGALSGTAKNFTVENAVIEHISTGDATDNGVAVVAGSLYKSGAIDNVHVVNATVNGNRYVAGIAGYVYGDITNCTVTDSKLTATPNDVSDVSDDQVATVALLAVASEDGEDGPKYDNGDKVGGIAGYFSREENDVNVLDGNTVSNTTLTGYRDVGGIVGYVTAGNVVTNNCVEDITLVRDKNPAYDYKGSEYKSDADYDVRAIIGDSEKEPVDLSNVVVMNGRLDEIKVSGKQTVASDEEVNEALEKGVATVFELTEGTYIIPDSAQEKNVTFIGTGDPEDTVIATQDDGSYEGCDYSLDGATATFENISINTDSTTYTGYARLNATYNNCVINGTYTLYGDSTFNNCTFNVTGDVYNIWTWGAPTATFNNCTFNSDGKAMLLYGTVNTKLTLNNCTFNDNGGLSDLKAAVEIGNDYGKSYELIVNNTVVNGYEINDKGINTGTTLWGNKNSMDQDHLNVVVNGVDVY